MDTKSHTVQTNRELPCPFIFCTSSTLYNRDAFERHIHGHEVESTPYVDRTKESWAACPLCVSGFDDREDFRGHMIDHSRNEFPKITEYVEMISKLYDRYMPENQEEFEMIHQPDTAPVCQELILREFKQSYRKLQTLLESRLEDMKDQSITKALSDILNQYHDLLSMMYHPGTSESTLNKMSSLSDQVTPTDIWDKGMHPVLMVLQARLPGSYWHTSSAVGFCYSILAGIYEQFPKHRSTWASHKDKLSKYCQAHGVTHTWVETNKRGSQL